ncbi:ABC-2 type transport system permease protein [Oceanobacillus limi]|uniref:ABC-2 type transport system permease protein n=1 Tax=Oceanobacillus limi TaxID=930131 RepID=A0A1I0FFK9_9BACI|nr:ABC transporter permease [Oceanobacillus limi]SET56884.1 ABC-2 type transport system permease protein [Oceanobacillus limi]
MLSFLKKDLLVFWRDRKEILVALLLPIVLIVVLNFAFSGFLNGETDSIHLNVALVQDDNESLGFEKFEERVHDLDISTSDKESILKKAQLLSPTELLNTFFSDPELEEFISIQKLEAQEATNLVEKGDLDALINIPEGFTYSVLSSMLLDETTDKELIIEIKEESTEAGALQSMVSNYLNTLNFQFALGQVSGTAMSEPNLPQGGREVIDGVDPYTMADYFTFAIGTLFALFTASTLTAKTVTEKRERVFHRIMLTNSKPFDFLMGKVISTFGLTWIQLIITLVATHLLLDIFSGETSEYLLGIFIVITAFSIAVAGLAALFTPITLRLNDPDLSNGIFMIVIMVMGVIGGNFFPIDFLPEWIKKVGEWTPNGLTQTTLLKWVQYSSPTDLLVPIILLVSFFMICLFIGLFLFPKRGRM